MDLSRCCACALALAGALIFVLGVSWGEVVVSTSPLSAPTTGPVALAPEPFLCPLAIKDADIVSPFGKRDVLAVSTTTVSETAGTKQEMHEGIDYGSAPGSEVRAARSGKVIFAGFSKMYVSRANKNDPSRLVIIRHADGQSSRYVHLDGFRVRPGQDVQAGQVIGIVRGIGRMGGARAAF